MARASIFENLDRLTGTQQLTAWVRNSYVLEDGHQRTQLEAKELVIALVRKHPNTLTQLFATLPVGDVSALGIAHHVCKVGCNALGKEAELERLTYLLTTRRYIEKLGALGPIAFQEPDCDTENSSGLELISMC